MKRHTPDHPKTLELLDRLGVALPMVVGYLELLWHFTAKYAPAGDVGRYSDSAIAKACGWDGDPRTFVEALADKGWLDKRSDCRLYVHDWHEHADDYVHAALCRALKTFANGVEPSDKRLTKKERATLRSKRARQALQERSESALPSRAVPSPGDTATDPPLTPPAVAVGARSRTPTEAARLADELAALYRDELGRAPTGRTVRHWRTELRQGVDEAAIAALIVGQAAEERAARDVEAAEAARWREAAERIDQLGGCRRLARAALDWAELHRRPDESVDAALKRWHADSGFPAATLQLLAQELYVLQSKSAGASGRADPPAEDPPGTVRVA